MAVSKHNVAEMREDAVQRNMIPLWAASDIDRWTAHLQNSSFEEAKDSHMDYDLIAWQQNCIVLRACEVDIVVILSHRDGLTLIDCYGEGDVTHYVGIMEGFHEVYIASHE